MKTMNKSRLLREEDVIRTVDRHTRDDGTLDNDISCILEEVKDVFDMKNEIKIVPETTSSLTIPRVFIFDTNLDPNVAVELQRQLVKQLKEGCIVLDKNIRSFEVEDLYKKRKCKH